MDFFWAAPPVTRTLAAAVFVVSVLSAVNIVTPYSLVYIPTAVFRVPPQLWRIVSSFLLTFKTGIIMDPFFIWQSGVPLETNSPRFNSASFFTYIIFVGVSLIPRLAVTVPGTEGDYPYITLESIIRNQSFRTNEWCKRGGKFSRSLHKDVCFMSGGFRSLHLLAFAILAGHILGAPLLLGPLSLAITYTFAQENRGQRVQFFVINMDVKWLPYARLLLTFIMGDPINALIDAMGIVVAHFYDFLTIYWPAYGNGTNFIRTPAFVTKIFSGDGNLNVQVEHKGYGTSQRARPSNSSTSDQPSGSSAWRSRGPGRRLGGD